MPPRAIRRLVSMASFVLPRYRSNSSLATEQRRIVMRHWCPYCAKRRRSGRKYCQQQICPSRRSPHPARCRKRMSRLFRLSGIAPKIVDTILAGEQPQGFNARTLLTTDLPIQRPDQKAELGFLVARQVRSLKRPPEIEAGNPACTPWSPVSRPRLKRWLRRSARKCGLNKRHCASALGVRRFRE